MRIIFKIIQSLQLFPNSEESKFKITLDSKSNLKTIAYFSCFIIR